jgi:TfoX N-terminal domain
MAYDEELAGRIRELVSGESGLTEQKMFGGLAFLIGGNMAVAASGQGGVLVHVDKAESEELVASTSAYPMEMRGRQMQGWLRVDAEDVSGTSELAARPTRGRSPRSGKSAHRVRESRARTNRRKR